MTGDNLRERIHSLHSRLEELEGDIDEGTRVEMESRLDEIDEKVKNLRDNGQLGEDKELHLSEILDIVEEALNEV